MRSILIFILLCFPNIIFGQIPNTISKTEKIYGLSKFWQEVNYNFVYLNKIDREKWENLYKELLMEVQETQNDYEYFRSLQKFSAFLNDGHTNVFFPKSIYDNISSTDFGSYKFHLSNVEGKAIITGINENKNHELPVGTEIIKVNGKPTREYMSEYVLPYISSSTDHIREDWGNKISS